MSGSNSTALAASSTGLLSMAQACRLAGCCSNTIRKYCNLGQLPTYRVLGGQRRFLRDDLIEFFGIEINKEENECGGGKVLAYGRVSTGGQAKGFSRGEENDLKRQIERLKEYSQENYSVEPIVYHDIGSGLSYGTRKSFIRLLTEIMKGYHDGAILLLTTKDRLARFGVELIELACRVHSVRIIYTEKGMDESQSKELADDILNIIHVFSSRQCAMRSAERQLKHISPEVMGRILALRESGMAISRIADVVNGEGLRTKDGAAIGVGVIRRKLGEQLSLEKQQENSIEKYVAECLEVGAENLRIKKSDLYEHYARWAKAKGMNPVSRNMSGRQLGACGLKETKMFDKTTGTAHAWVGIVIKDSKKLSCAVVAKPRSKPTVPIMEAENNFVRFYSEELKGKFRGYRKDLDRQYLQWCKDRKVRKISLRDIPKLLLSLGNHFPTVRCKGFIYEL